MDDAGATMQEIADELGVTHQRVSQIMAKALAKLRPQLEPPEDITDNTRGMPGLVYGCRRVRLEFWPPWAKEWVGTR